MASYVVDMSAPDFETQQTIEQAWEVSRQCLIGGSPFIVIPASLQDAVGPQGIEIIAQRYSALIRAPVEVSQNDVIEAITMKALTCEPDQKGVETTLSPPKVSQTAFETVPATQLSETDTPLAETPMRLNNLQTRRLSKIPKPPNAFILYRQHHHPLVKASNPSLHNNQISIILGKQWKNESDATKTSFYARAEEMKQQQCNANPELHQRSRTSPGRRSRKARSRAPSFAKASPSSIDPVLLNPSLTFDSSSLSVLPFAPDTESVLDSVEESAFSDELPNADVTASLFCTDNCILDPSEVASSTSEEPFVLPAIGCYVGDEEFARMMSRELGEDL